MNIVCLIIVPLFFMMISIYFRLWMDNDDFRRVRALFLWGLAVGVIYWTLLPLVSGQFDNKIAMSAVLVKSLLIDGLLFAGVVVTTLFGQWMGSALAMLQHTTRKRVPRRNP